MTFGSGVVTMVVKTYTNDVAPVLAKSHHSRPKKSVLDGREGFTMKNFVVCTVQLLYLGD